MNLPQIDHMRQDETVARMCEASWPSGNCVRSVRPNVRKNCRGGGISNDNQAGIGRARYQIGNLTDADTSEDGNRWAAIDGDDPSYRRDTGCGDRAARSCRESCLNRSRPDFC